MSENSNTTTLMTAKEARVITKEIKENSESLAELIHKAMCGQAHLALGYKTVEDWVGAEFGYSRSRAYQLFNWQHGKTYFIDHCDLSQGWTMLEGDLRPYTGKKLEEMVQKAKEAIVDVTDQQERDRIVEALITKENSDRKVAAEAMALALRKLAGKDKPVKKDNGADVTDSDNSTDVDTDTFPRHEVTLETAKMKVADTVSSLTKAASKQDFKSLLPTLQGARLTLDELIESIQGAGDSK